MVKHNQCWVNNQCSESGGVVHLCEWLYGEA